MKSKHFVAEEKKPWII